MRLLVTGASGFVGHHLVQFLQGSGHEVVALRRGTASGDSAREIFAGPADLAELDTFPAWPSGIEAVAHLAALNPPRGDPRAQDLEALRHANILGTAALARRARREGVRRVVFVGSASVHHGNGAPVRETDPLRPDTPYAVSKAEAETAFWQALAGNGSAVAGCVLRPAPVFGPGGRNAVASLARLARLPLPLPLAGLGQPRSLVSVESLAEAIALCLTREEADRRTFLVANDGPLTPSDIVSVLRQGQGRGPGILPAPVGLGTLAAHALQRGEAWKRLRKGLVLDTSHLRRTLGWQPGTARDALRAMAALRQI